MLTKFTTGRSKRIKFTIWTITYTLLSNETDLGPNSVVAAILILKVSPKYPGFKQIPSLESHHAFT